MNASSVIGAAPEGRPGMPPSLAFFYHAQDDHVAALEQLASQSGH
jgi:hypothetical protein